MSDQVSGRWVDVYTVESDAERNSVRVCLAGLKNIFSWLKINSIFAGLTISCMLFVAFQLEGFCSIQALYASFFSVVAVYNLNKLTDLQEDTVNVPERARFVSYHRVGMILGIIACSCGALVCASWVSLSATLIVAAALSIGVLYSVKVPVFRLKGVPIVKNATVAGTCVAGAVLMPSAEFYYGANIVLLVAFFVFFKTFINTLLFDVRDINGDTQSGNRTIPVILGLPRTRNLLFLLNSALVVWLTICYVEGFFMNRFLILVLSVFYGYWYIHHLSKKGSKLKKAAELLVEGEWIAVSLMFVLFGLHL